MLLAGIVFSFTLTSAVPVWYDTSDRIRDGRFMPHPYWVWF